MKVRFILGLLILLLSCALQFWFASAGVFVNFILGTLIVYAFLFDIWELVIFILAAIFIVNWQPAASVDIIVFALIPVAAYAFHKVSGWAAWAGAPAAIIVGFAILYLAIAPGAFLQDWRLFLMDIFGSLVFGVVVLATLERLRRA